MNGIRRVLTVRYGLRSLVLVLTTIAIACFWITWPQRTARTFAEDYFSRQVEEAPNPYRAGTAAAAWFESDVRQKMRQELHPMVMSPHRRSWWDVVLGRQTFDCMSHEFTVVRGQIPHAPIAFFDSGYRYYR